MGKTAQAVSTGILGLVVLGLAACAGEDPDIRRGNVFFSTHNYYEAMQAYEKAYARSPKLKENKEFIKNFKNAYYYYGGSLEMSGSLEAAVKYYEKGFDLDPNDVAICDKLAKYFWKEEDFEKSVKFFSRLVELDADMPDNAKKWATMGEDGYALGYALHEVKKYPEAIEALQQSLKVSPKGAYAAKAKSALEAARAALKAEKKK